MLLVVPWELRGDLMNSKQKKYVKDVFSHYEKSDVLPDILHGRTIIHVYATHDTDEGGGVVNGYVDSFYFDVHIYNGKTWWEITGRDQIELNVKDSRVRIFKDGSTMIIIDRPIRFGMYQSLEINEA